MSTFYPFTNATIEHKISVITNKEALEQRLFQALRYQDLIKFSDPHDDHPSLAMTGPELRMKMSMVVTDLLLGMEIKLISK